MQSGRHRKLKPSVLVVRVHSRTRERGNGGRVAPVCKTGTHVENIAGSNPAAPTKFMSGRAATGETGRSQKPLFMVVRIHSAGPRFAQVMQFGRHLRLRIWVLGDRISSCAPSPVRWQSPVDCTCLLNRPRIEYPRAGPNPALTAIFGGYCGMACNRSRKPGRGKTRVFDSLTLFHFMWGRSEWHSSDS